MRTIVVCAAALALVGTAQGSVRPQDDLFSYANGAWLRSVEIPGDRVTFGTFAELADKTETDLKAIVDEAVAHPSGSPSQQIADLYLSATNETRIEQLGAEPLRPELARIDAIRSASDLAAEIGHVSSIGAGGPFAGSAGADPRRPEATLVRVTPGGTLLPGRAYYFDADPPFAGVRAKYESYLTRLFTLCGRAAPAAAARDVLSLETEIARAQWPDTPAAGEEDGRFTLRELTAAMPGFDWTAWARPQGIDRAPAVILARPVFFKAFASLVPRVPLETWRYWLVARYVTAAAPYLSSPFDLARFDFFGTILTGQELPRTRWKRGVSLVSGYLGDALGRLYVERHFPSSARARARRLVADVLQMHKAALAEAAWMTPSARRDAQSRLSAIAVGIGYPDEWRSYAGLTIARDDLFGNWLRALAFENAERVRHSGSAAIWVQTPQTVNAAYVPSSNSIVVPAAILQPPVFDAAADDAVNFGAAGALVGHEITHAFESSLGDFDATRLFAQLNALEPLPGARVNALATARETLGDIAGLSIAFRAYTLSLKGRPSPEIDGLTGEQRFFLAWARMWRAKERAEYVRSTLQTSAHLPATLRANVAASNVDGFYEAFGLKPGDGLYRPPQARVRVW